MRFFLFFFQTNTDKLCVTCRILKWLLVTNELFRMTCKIDPKWLIPFCGVLQRKDAATTRQAIHNAPHLGGKLKPLHQILPWLILLFRHINFSCGVEKPPWLYYMLLLWEAPENFPSCRPGLHQKCWRKSVPITLKQLLVLTAPQRDPLTSV